MGGRGKSTFSITNQPGERPVSWFNKKKVNSHRSHISVYDGKLDSLSIIKNSKVKNLMTGIHNKRPAKSTFIWDLEVAL